MSSVSTTDSETFSFLIRLSNQRRRTVESQKLKNYKIRQYSLVELYTFQFLPVVITSSILAPLNRIKLILQVKDLNTTVEGGKNNLTGREVLNSIYIFKNRNNE